MKTYLTAYLATGLAFLAIDSVWLTVMASRLYRPLLGPMLVDGFVLTPAILFYLIYIFGLVFFAVRPALSAGDWQTATLHGALFGFCAYATYDLTNQATLKGWPVQITVADLIWGTLLSAVAATVGFAVARRFAS